MSMMNAAASAGRRVLPNHWDLIALAAIMAVLTAIARAYHGISAPLPTANAAAVGAEAEPARADFIPDPALNPFFAATIESIDEAVLNALVANETMVGADDHVIHALPHDQVRRLIAPPLAARRP